MTSQRRIEFNHHPSEMLIICNDFRCMSLDISTMISIYSSELTTTMERYSRDQCQASNYYYQSLKFRVDTSGFYKFSSNSSVHMYGYLYHDTFNPFDPSHNLLVENDNMCTKEQISFDFSLCTHATYVLVVTTQVSGRTGAFMIQVLGSGNITFNRLGKPIIHCCSL
jgi:hypothetical protein